MNFLFQNVSKEDLAQTNEKKTILNCEPCPCQVE